MSNPSQETDFENLLNKPGAEIEAARRSQEAARLSERTNMQISSQASDLIAQGHASGMRRVPPSQMSASAKNGPVGTLEFEHTYNYKEGGIQNSQTSRVLLTPDPTSGDIKARVSGQNMFGDVSGSFSIGADGKVQNSTLNKNDAWHKAILGDTTAQVESGLKLSRSTGSFDQKVAARWEDTRVANNMAGEVVSKAAVEHLPPDQAVKLGNTLTGAEQKTGGELLQGLTVPEGEREMASLMRGEAKIGKLGAKFGGAAAGLVIGTGSALAAETPEEAGKVFAETAVPGGASAVALAANRPTEAVLRGVEEIPVAGGVATEILRGPLRAAGADVDPSLTSQLVDVKPIELTHSQKDFFDTYERLPEKAQPGMPPEVESLVEAKGMVRQAEGHVEAANAMSPSVSPGTTDKGASMASAQKSLDFAQGHYQEQYDTLQKSGQMKEVVEPWLEANAGQNTAPAPTQQTPAPTAPEAVAAAKPAEEEKPAYTPPRPAMPAPAPA